MGKEQSLVKLDIARRALAAAKSIQEVKDVRDKAEAIRIYMRQRDGSLEAQNDAAEIKLRAERRLGEMLATDGERRGGNCHGGSSAPLPEGVSHNQSSRWQQVASVPESEFERHVVETKAKGELTTESVRRLAKEIKREGQRENNRRLVETSVPIEEAVSRTYSAVVIDPPWDWGDEGDQDQFGRSRPTYATMTFEQVSSLPVSTLADANAHLYLWITNRSLPKGFQLLDAWGFRYVTCLTWCKPSIGMGNYFRGSTEQILFGVRGSLELLRSNVGTWFMANRPKEHSAKPDEFFELVESCSPGPWLELFARTPRKGWVAWGAEV